MIRSSMLTLALLAISVPAYAGSVTGEIRFADPRGRTSDSTEYKVEYNDSIANLANYGVELQTKQNENAGTPTSRISAKLGPRLPEIIGFKPAVYVEFGHALNTGNNFNFWGVGAKVSHSIYGPVSVSAGYRHREGFSSGNMRENRLNAGINVELAKNWSTGVQYYRTRGSRDSDAVGISVTRNF